MDNNGGIIALYNLPSYNFYLGSHLKTNGLIDAVSVTAKSHISHSNNMEPDLVHTILRGHVTEIVVDEYSIHDQSLNNCDVTESWQQLPATLNRPNYPCYVNENPVIDSINQKSNLSAKFDKIVLNKNGTFEILFNLEQESVFQNETFSLIAGTDERRSKLVRSFVPGIMKGSNYGLIYNLDESLANGNKVYLLLFKGSYSDFIYLNYNWDLIVILQLDLWSWSSNYSLETFPGTNPVIFTPSFYELNQDQVSFFRPNLEENGKCQAWKFAENLNTSNESELLSFQSNQNDGRSAMLNEIDIFGKIVEIKANVTYYKFFNYFSNNFEILHLFDLLSLVILDSQNKPVVWFNLFPGLNLVSKNFENDVFDNRSLLQVYSLSTLPNLIQKPIFNVVTENIFQSSCQTVLLLPYQHSFKNNYGKIWKNYLDVVKFGDHCYATNSVGSQNSVETNLISIRSNQQTISRCNSKHCNSYQILPNSIGYDNNCDADNYDAKFCEQKENQNQEFENYIHHILISEVGGLLNFGGYPSFVELSGYPSLQLDHISRIIVCSTKKEGKTLNILESSLLKGQSLNSEGFLSIELDYWKHASYNCECSAVILVYNVQQISFYEMSDIVRSEIIDGLVFNNQAGYSYDEILTYRRYGSIDSCDHLTNIVTPGSISTSIMDRYCGISFQDIEIVISSQYSYFSANFFCQCFIR